MAKCEICNISPPWFGVLAVNDRAFRKILLFSHQNLPFFKHVKNKFNILIPPSYGQHFGNYNMGIIGVKYTIFMQNAI